VLARLLWNLNLLLTGAELSMISDIGPGVVILHPISAQVFGRVGADCTFWGHNVIGGGRSQQDIGGGPGLPVVGDRVSFAARAMVLGPVRIGDDCNLGPGTIVTRDLPPGSQVEVPQQRHVHAMDTP
jgi:serine O-acetyltransferase